MDEIKLDGTLTEEEAKTRVDSAGQVLMEAVASAAISLQAGVLSASAVTLHKDGDAPAKVFFLAGAGSQAEYVLKILAASGLKIEHIDKRVTPNIITGS